MPFFASIRSFSDLGFFVLRLVIGAIFLKHGLAKRGMWKMAPSAQMSPAMLKIMRLLSICEPLGGVAMIAGFLTQVVALCFGIIMVGAITTKVRGKVPFMAFDKTGWEFDAVLLAANIMLYFQGGGAFSLDRTWFGL